MTHIGAMVDAHETPEQSRALQVAASQDALAAVREADPDRARAADERIARLKAYTESEARRVASLNGVTKPAPKKRGKRPPEPEGIKPTPEWLAKHDHRQTSPTNESGFKLGRAYQREPWFETLVKRDWSEARRDKREPVYTVANLNALRFYRDQYEASQRSETACALALQGSRAKHEYHEPSLAVTRARDCLAMIEAGIGGGLSTLRAVTLRDEQFAAIAMVRFGSRSQNWFDATAGRFVDKQVPRSQRHPTLVREEFVLAVGQLTTVVEGVFGRA